MSESLSADAFFEFMKGHPESINTRFDSVQNEISKIVSNQNEMTKIVTKLNEKQGLLGDKQLNLENDHISLQSRVSSIESQLAELKNKSSPANETITSIVNNKSPDTSVIDLYNEAIESIIAEAKKIIGFSPINNSDLERLKLKHGIVSDPEAMVEAVREFLKLEMIASDDFISTVSIEKAFPSRQSSLNRVYVKFTDQRAIDYVWSLAKNLNTDAKVMQWIPPQFYQRFRAIDEAAFHLRKGPQKYKSSIRFGKNDLIFKKRAQFGSWTIEAMDSFPPIELSAKALLPSSSPPQGRSRIENSKRLRSPQSETRTSKHLKTAKETNDNVDSGEDSNPSTPIDPKISSEVKITSIETVATTQKNSGEDHPKSITPSSSLPSTTDHGIFAPSACLSPKFVSNKDFTFRGSKIPSVSSMKSLNC